jgi:aspartate carbamoyltransferase catalytic subunit
VTAPFLDRHRPGVMPGRAGRPGARQHDGRQTTRQTTEHDRTRRPAAREHTGGDGFAGRHVLSMRQFTRGDLSRLFHTADRMYDLLEDGGEAAVAAVREGTGPLGGRVLMSAFFERSTRTRLVHETAMLRLGGTVSGFSDPAVTRAGGSTHEADEDVVRMLGLYADVVVVRHPRTGWPAEAAAQLDEGTLLINGGDGVGEHPTQTMTDLYTLHRRLGTLDGRRLLVVNDLRMRCVRSLLLGLRHYDCEVLGLPADGKGAGPAPITPPGGQPLHPCDDLREALPEVDAVYSSPTVAMEAPGGDGSADPERGVRIDRRLLQEYGSEGLAVLHPLPRGPELARDVDDTPFNAYWEQARSGLAVRMALLSLMFEAA